MKRIRVVIQGVVQGVGFRAATTAEADRIGATGWVRNVGSDRVEVEVQGDEHQVDEMRQWLRHGPTYAAVEDVAVMDVERVADETRFVIAATRH